MGNRYPVVVETQEYKLNLEGTQTEGIIYHLITPTVCAPALSTHLSSYLGEARKVSLSPS